VGVERYHLLISGRVQGVGYRYSIRNIASKLGLVGWVKNRDDSKVEIVAEGDKISLEELVEWAKHGPRFSKVDAVDIELQPASDEFLDFNIH
jgi:acylphosphatase